MGARHEPSAFCSTVLDGAPFGFALLDAQDAIRWCNGTFARLMAPDAAPAAAAGRAPGAWAGTRAADLFDAEGAEDFRAFAAACRKEGPPDPHAESPPPRQSSVILCPAGTGGMRPLKITGTILRDAAGGSLLLSCRPWGLLSSLDGATGPAPPGPQGCQLQMILAAGPRLEDCRVLAANGAAGQRLAEAGATVPGCCSGELGAAALPEALRAAAEAAFAEGRSHSAMYTTPAGPGGFAVVQRDFWPLNRQNGRVTHWMDCRRLTRSTTGQLEGDLPWLQMAADALRATDVGIWHWDLQSGNVTFSPRLMAQLGYDIAAIDDAEAFLTRIYHPEDLPLLRQSIDEAVAGSGHFSQVVRLLDHRGRLHWIAVQGQVITDETGRALRIFGTEADVTEETLMRDRLLRAERIARIGNWSLTVSPPGMYWSPECYRIHGMSPERFKPSATQMTYLMHPEDRVLLQDAFRRTLRENAPNSGDHDRFRGRIIRGDGEIRDCEFTAIIEHDGDGMPAGLTGTVQDITEQTEVEKRLIQAQKMEVVGQMAGGIAHDFNNLLAVVVGNLELLEETCRISGGSEMIRSAIEAARKGAGLTRNLLSFARKATLEPARLDLNALLAELDRMLARVLPSAIELDCRFAEGLWSVHADRNSFENALLNLAINARDAMEGVGRLTIETRNVQLEAPFLEDGQEDLAPGAYAVVAVTDTGIGMTAEQLGRVFTPFYSTKPPSEGSGLGLPMVQGFARQSGGGVRVYSEPGRGTTVKLFLPASDIQASPPPRAESAAPEEAMPTGRILLVEDDPGVARVLSLRLQRMGLEVVTACSGDEALDMFPAVAPVDVLLTDIVMPGALQGPALARRLRQLDPGLRVIFMSGYPEHSAEGAAPAEDADISLMKPISRRDLTRALRRAIGPGA
ncbi:hybrid sensor histidine kinase/response regulator [Mangrovicoccus algicola]|uniref:histidine kinase n=1 Tax=Mangrovicoccus algicola TaxID=2771008 RepID=A0A8J6Z8H6_9RHOB|nr:PAS domain-containing sensor histidine kinase [Mangrovicoccus algicola]MBE3639849.1 PAS domain-containing protein [Mangrovicoccus algicola]